MKKGCCRLKAPLQALTNTLWMKNGQGQFRDGVTLKVLDAKITRDSIIRVKTSSGEFLGTGIIDGNTNELRVHKLLGEKRIEA